MNTRFALAAILACVAARPAAGQATAGNGAVQTQITAAWRKFAADLKAGDSASVAAMFTPDAMIAYNTEARGTDALRTYWGRVARTYVYDDVTFTTEDFAVAGNMAADFGILAQRYRRKSGGASSTQRMHYAAIWKRQADGTWKLHRFIATVAPLPG